MAVLVSRASGNFTSSSTWCVCDTVSALDTTAYSSTITTSYTYTANFSPGAITVQGIALYVYSRATSPTGTMDVALRNTTDNVDVAVVTVNVSDLSNSGWHFFKFSSNVTLSAGKNYAVGVRTSSTSQVGLYRDSTSNNWCRYLVTTTTQAPATGDKLIIVGELISTTTKNPIIVTLDNTDTSLSVGSTSYTESIAIGNLGSLVLENSANKNYYLKWKGLFRVWGTLTIGTESNPVPSSSTVTFFMDSASAGEAGMELRNNSTITVYGATKSNVQSLLVSDVSAGSSTIVVADASGWQVGDRLAIAPTRRTYTEYEDRTISAINGNTITLSSALSYPHSGTSPTQAEVINLSRNVIFTGPSSSITGFISGNWSGVNATFDSVEFRYLGSSTSGRNGFVMDNVTSNLTLRRCSIWGAGAVSGSLGFRVRLVNGGSATLEDCVAYYCRDYAFHIGGTATLRRCTAIGTTYSSCIQSYNEDNLTFEDIRTSGSAAHGVYIELTSNTTNGQVVSNLSGSIISHSNSGCGIYFYAVNHRFTSSASLLRVYRNAGTGYCQGITFSGNGGDFRQTQIESFGNAGSAMTFHNNAINSRFRFRNVTAYGEPSFSQPSGLSFTGSSAYICTIEFIDSSFSSHTTADLNLNSGDTVYRIFLYRTDLLSTTKIATVSNIINAVVHWAGTTNDINFHRTYYFDTSGLSYYNIGTIEKDSTIYYLYPPSEKVIPASSSIKTKSTPKRKVVDGGSTVTFQVWVRKSSSYNGNQPRLMLRANPAFDIHEDTVLATMTAGTETWQLLAGQTPQAPADGVFEAYVDCDGTAGFINVDDWS